METNALLQSVADETALRRLWRGSPSKLQGYTRNYHTTTEEGDEIQVDFHYARSMVRIQLELARENSKQYIAVIKNGIVLQERDFTGNRSVDLTSRIGRFKNHFKYLPDNNVLSAIEGLYGLPVKNSIPLGFERKPINWDFFKPRRIRDIVADYLKEKRRKEKAVRSPFKKLLRRLPADVVDLSIAGLLFFLFLNRFLTPGEFAFASGAFGLMTGAFDWLWRQRNPMVLKIALMMGLAAYAVWYEVQMRLWGIIL